MAQTLPRLRKREFKQRDSAFSATNKSKKKNNTTSHLWKGHLSSYTRLLSSQTPPFSSFYLSATVQLIVSLASRQARQLVCVKLHFALATLWKHNRHEAVESEHNFSLHCFCFSIHQGNHSYSKQIKRARAGRRTHADTQTLYLVTASH